MNIIAHRGLWKTVEQKNSMQAFKDAIASGYGIETDLREFNGKMVLSHDVANSESVVCADLFDWYAKENSNVVLALNVKEDGIQAMAKELLEKYKITNYFFFDMSVPEMVVYDRMRLPYFTRHSDIERELVLFDRAFGVWVDAFYNDWDMVEAAKEHIKKGKKVSMISPEIHGKDEQKVWEDIKNKGLQSESGFCLCTDYPDKANDYFNGR